MQQDPVAEIHDLVDRLEARDRGRREELERHRRLEADMGAKVAGLRETAAKLRKDLRRIGDEMRRGDADEPG